MIFALAILGCTAEPPAPPPVPRASVQVALRGPSTPIDPIVRAQRAVLCECEVTCRTTGDSFSGFSAISLSLACAQARSACRAAGCTLCANSSGACE